MVSKIISRPCHHQHNFNILKKKIDDIYFTIVSSYSVLYEHSYKKKKKKLSVESWGSALCREQRCPSKALWLGLFLNTFLNYIPEIFGS